MKVPEDAKLDILIIGAGLAGISTAIVCASHGHTVTVLEAAKELAEIGAGLQITPNAAKVLQLFDLPQSFWDAGAIPKTLSVHRYSGDLLAQTKHFDEDMMKKYGAPFIDMHRVDLQKALHERAVKLGVKFVMNQRVESMDFSRSKAKATTKAGDCFTVDLVVAADGLWSAASREISPDIPPPRPTGDLAYRIVLTIDQVQQDPELNSWIANPEVHFWIGPRSHVVAYSLRACTMLNIVLLVPDDLPEGVAKQPGSLEEMKKLFEGWDPVLTKFLDKVEHVDKWKLMYREDELPSWINKKSTLVLVGDACHPMLPYLAQGANSAIEDGAVLGSLLGAITSKAQVPHALKIYENLRKARGEAIVRETFKQRHDFHMEDGEEQRARDKVFLSQLGKDKIEGAFPSRWTCPQVQPWLYGYDAFKEVEQALKREPLRSVA